MWKIAKYMVLPVLITVVLVAGVSAAAFADDGKPGKGNWKDRVVEHRSKLVERAGQILGIDKQKLIDAFKQANGELREDAFENRLDKWVTDGKLTQEQAAQVKAWLDARPDVPVAGPKVMEQLLKDGKITQAQYGAYKTWLDQRPKIDWPKPQQNQGNGPGKRLKNNQQNVN